MKPSSILSGVPLAPAVSTEDAEHMKRALALARRGEGLVSPGALVGAVIVKDGAILGEAFYTYDGVDHAEVLALRQAGDLARGATLYITLEPCSHFGRTPPCADALIQAGILRVVAATGDPNPVVNGTGFAKLRQAGMAVVSGVLEHEARLINEAFMTYQTQKRPFGILKIAMTLDGKIATRTGESRWITSEESRTRVQALRHKVDAVITGSGTFLKDRPRLTDRTGLPRRRELLRIVLDRRGRITPESDWLRFDGSLEALVSELFARETQSFLLECGPDLAFNAARAGIIDKLIVFIAPKLAGGPGVLAFGGAGVERLNDVMILDDLMVEPSGPDLLLTAYVRRNNSGNLTS